MSATPSGGGKYRRNRRVSSCQMPLPVMATRVSRRARLRARRGASLALVLAVFGTLAMAILLFAMNFTGFIGSYHEQRTAIEAAALQASKDIASIVIDDPNFGLVGLSDCSPVGTNTKARDGFYTSVTGINTLLATIRLDMIIAYYLQDPLMQQFAKTDYDNALIAQKKLVDALRLAIAPNGTGQDAYGNTLNPTQDAIKAYMANKIHLAIGQSCTLVPGSLTLSLGYVDGLSTRTPVPQPADAASVQASQQSEGFYLPDVTINYSNKNTSGNIPFVFGAMGLDTTLVDFRDFKSTINGVPYSTPTIVKVDADEHYLEAGVMSHTIHATAAAMPGTIVDQRPHPGAFTITLVDGPVPEISQFSDFINYTQAQTDPIDTLQSPVNGDYPNTPLSKYSMPFMPDPDPFHPRFQNVLSLAIYDWVRRGGTHVNVQSLVTALQTPMNFGGGNPQMQCFHLLPSGAVTNDSQAWGQENFCVSHNQYRAITGLGLNSQNGNAYDLQITDFVRIPGRTNGGKHAGEPLDLPGLTGNNPNAGSYAGPSLYENITWPYLEFLTATNSKIRPTYNTEGIAVDLTVRKRQY